MTSDKLYIFWIVYPSQYIFEDRDWKLFSIDKKERPADTAVKSLDPQVPPVSFSENL